MIKICENLKKAFDLNFQMYTRISNKVVGLLLAAKKRNLLHFEGEMLFQVSSNLSFCKCEQKISMNFYNFLVATFAQILKVDYATYYEFFLHKIMHVLFWFIATRRRRSHYFNEIHRRNSKNFIRNQHGNVKRIHSNRSVFLLN